MGVSDPEAQKKVFGPRWQHEIEAKLVHMESANASFPTLSILQTENSKPKKSMSVTPLVRQLTGRWNRQ
jgi:hypothetical protein